MNFYLILLLGFFALNSCSNKEIVGKFTWEDWKKEAAWNDYEAESYKLNNEDIAKLSEYLTKYKVSFVLVSGAWCHDSEEEMPRILKVLNSAKMNEEAIEIYGVGRQKDAKDGIRQKYEIEKVPTLIIYKNGKEIGRILEHPDNSWERDLWQIIEE